MLKFVRALLACVLALNLNVAAFAANNPELAELIRKKETTLQADLAEVTAIKSQLDQLQKAIVDAKAANSRAKYVGIPLVIVGGIVFVAGAHKVATTKGYSQFIDLNPLVKLFYGAIAAAGATPAAAGGMLMYVKASKASKIEAAIEEAQNDVTKLEARIKQDQEELAVLKKQLEQ